jgi:hypothetical protein
MRPERARYYEPDHVPDTLERGNGDRTGGRQRQAERGGDFNDPPPF